MSPRLATCKSPDCAARIIWAMNPETGKKVPLDAAPTPSDDRLVLRPTHHYVLEPGGETCRKVTWEEWQDHSIEVRISHWRTCRDPKRFSGRAADGATYSRPNTSAEQ